MTKKAAPQALAERLEQRGKYFDQAYRTAAERGFGREATADLLREAAAALRQRPQAHLAEKYLDAIWSEIPLDLQARIMGHFPDGLDPIRLALRGQRPQEERPLSSQEERSNVEAVTERAIRLDRLLNRDDDPAVTILPNGTVAPSEPGRVLSAPEERPDLIALEGTCATVNAPVSVTAEYTIGKAVTVVESDSELLKVLDAAMRSSPIATVRVRREWPLPPAPPQEPSR
jgi:hypothetical protein